MDLCVLCSGIYHAIVGEDNKHVFTYENRGSFGELALLYNMPRAATIKATTTGHIWALDRQTFRRIVLKSAFRKRKMYEELINCVPMLKALQNYERLNLADALISKSFAAGEQIIKQGEFKERHFRLKEKKNNQFFYFFSVVSFSQVTQLMECTSLKMERFQFESFKIVEKRRKFQSSRKDNISVNLLW